MPLVGVDGGCVCAHTQVADKVAQAKKEDTVTADDKVSFRTANA